MFSPNELKIISIIGKKKIKISEIGEKFYKGKKTPENSRIIIANTISRIDKKCKKNKSIKFKVKGFGIGSKGKTVWLENK